MNPPLTDQEVTGSALALTRKQSKNSNSNNNNKGKSGVEEDYEALRHTLRNKASHNKVLVG